MRRRKGLFRLLAGICVSLLLINMLILYSCFKITATDILNVVGNTCYRIAGSIHAIGAGGTAESHWAGTGMGDAADIAASDEGTEGENTSNGDNEADAEAYRSPGANMNSGGTSSYYMTANAVASLYSMGLADKLTALSIMSKLGTAKLNRIIELSKNGVTLEEYNEIESIARSDLSSEDIEVLKKILDKYKMLYAQED